MVKGALYYSIFKVQVRDFALTLYSTLLADCAFFLSVVIEAQTAVAHFCRVFKTTQNHHAAASWGKALYLRHHSLEGVLTR